MDNWVVYKYELGTGNAVITLPAGAQVLSVAFQGESLQLWALVNTEETSKEMRHFRTYATGEPIEEGTHLRFIGTAHHPARMVFHVFEVE